MAKRCLIGVVLALGGAPSCERSTGTHAPDADGAHEGGTAAAGVELRYAIAPGKLRQTGAFDITTTGGGAFGQATIAYTVALDLAAAGKGLEVVWDVTGIDQLEVDGTFGGAATVAESKAFLLAEAAGATVIDALGKPDAAATAARPHNAARLRHLAAAATSPVPRLGLLALAEAMVALPELPAARLEIGKGVVVEDEEEAEMGGIVLPSATATKYTLLRIDSAGGTRIADVQIEAETRGAIEVPDGMLSVSISSEGLLLFDLDAGVPVAWKVTRSQTIELGPKGFESTVILSSSYDRG